MPINPFSQLPATAFIHLPQPLSDQAEACLKNWRSTQAQKNSVESLALDVSDDQLRPVFASSHFIVRQFDTHLDIIESLLASGDLVSKYKSDQYIKHISARLAAVDDEKQVMQQLRQFRNREMVRIAWRDLAGWSNTEETLFDLSLLAEACIDAALNYAQQVQTQRHGVPRCPNGKAQKMVAIGMGKLGGHELNFSSDIDLIFCYPENGLTDGQRPIENGQFFIRAGQIAIKLLNETTVDGFVYRVDMRLRPFGDSGPLSISFAAMEDYYLTHGRDWERYAMIKARVVAGDMKQGNILLKSLQPFVYRRYLDYGAFDALRDLKKMIVAEVERKGLRDNVKLGPGGIREIEFIGQAFQLVRGGHDPEFQSRQIIPTLKKLGASGQLEVDTCEKLLAAYDFLRRTENRLQILDDQQTHKLPQSDLDQQRLAYTMGYDSWELFLQTLDSHRECVQTHFMQVFKLDTDDSSDVPSVWESLWSLDINSDIFEQVVLEAGFKKAETPIQLRAFRQGSAYTHLSNTAQQRLDLLMPKMLEAVSAVVNPDETLNRILSFLERTAGRSVYLSLLTQQPQALKRLIGLFSASHWVAEFIIQHPIVIDELIDNRLSGHLLSKEDMVTEAQNTLNRHDEDLGEQMDALRRFKQTHICRIVTLDIEDEISLMQVSDQLTWLAESILEVATELIKSQLESIHGQPINRKEGCETIAEMAVIAYGKLGGIELSYSSDLDLVFLHNSDQSSASTSGPKVISNIQFFSKLVQKLVHFLTTLTPAGKLYDVDTRLRPNGTSGLLISSFSAFEIYQQSKAWTWEHQALVRTRIIIGSPLLKKQFSQIRNTILTQQHQLPSLLDDVCAMREKMRKALGSHINQSFHLKQDKGGVVDIEFMVQYAVLAWGYENSDLLLYTDNYRLLEVLRSSDLIRSDDVDTLKTAYLFYRMQLHRLALRDMPSTVEIDNELQHFCAQVGDIWDTLMCPQN